MVVIWHAMISLGAHFIQFFDLLCIFFMAPQLWKENYLTYLLRKILNQEQTIIITHPVVKANELLHLLQLFASGTFFNLKERLHSNYKFNGVQIRNYMDATVHLVLHVSDDYEAKQAQIVSVLIEKSWWMIVSHYDLKYGRTNHLSLALKHFNCGFISHFS